MLSIFQVTNQGKQTRSRLLETLQHKDGLTRNELAEASGLSYEQVRNQTQNLISEGAIVPRTVAGKRCYFVRIFAALLAVWLPICGVTIENDAVNLPDQNATNS